MLSSHIFSAGPGDEDSCHEHGDRDIDAEWKKDTRLTRISVRHATREKEGRRTEDLEGKRIKGRERFTFGINPDV